MDAKALKIKLSADWPYQLLFFLGVCVSYINNYELSLGIWIFIMLVTIKRFYSTKIFLYLSLFTFIALMGIIRSFFYQHETYNIIRDISYFIKPIIGLLIGYQCFRTNENNFFKTVIYTALGIAIIHYFTLFISALIYPIHNIHDLRYYGGYFSDFEAFALIILIFHKKFQLDFSKRKLYFLTLFIGGSLTLYLARTNIIQVFILFCGMLGLFQFTKKKLFSFIALILIIGIGYKIIYDMNPARKGDGFEAFLYKIKNAPKEIYDPYVINDNSARFHDNFRSYETKVTILQVIAREDSGLWLGNGFGSTVNYGTIVNTNDGSKIRHAPILHNGYTTVFLKTGLIGLAVYLCGMIYLSVCYPKTTINLLDNTKLLINSTGIFLFISSLVFLGYYLKLDNKSLFVGGLLAYYETLRNEYKK